MKLEEYFDRGVLHAGHPPIIDFVTLSAAEKELKAGTVLKKGENGFEPAADADTPAAVLLEDVAAHEGAVLATAVVHGLVVRSRLIDASDTEDAAASDTLAAKLPGIGIYLTQAGWSESNFN